jgi:hypothetical protein
MSCDDYLYLPPALSVAPLCVSSFPPLFSHLRLSLPFLSVGSALLLGMELFLSKYVLSVRVNLFSFPSSLLP